HYIYIFLLNKHIHLLIEKEYHRVLFDKRYLSSFAIDFQLIYCFFSKTLRAKEIFLVLPYWDHHFFNHFYSYKGLLILMCPYPYPFLCPIPVYIAVLNNIPNILFCSSSKFTQDRCSSPTKPSSYSEVLPILDRTGYPIALIRRMFFASSSCFSKVSFTPYKM